MPANTSPIFSVTPVIGKANLISTTIGALAASDGVGVISGGTITMIKLITGGANGTLISRIRIYPYATVAATNTQATVLRFYHSTQASGNTAATNTFVFQEIAVGIIAAAHATISISPIEFPCNFVIPANDTILVSTHAALAANTGFQILAYSGDL
jgi:hypothetical protein